MRVNRPNCTRRRQVELVLVNWIEEVIGAQCDGKMIFSNQAFKSLNADSRLFDFQCVFDRRWRLAERFQNAPVTAGQAERWKYGVLLKSRWAKTC